MRYSRWCICGTERQLRVDSLAVSNFRAFQYSEFSFDPKLNLIIGANGSGKSSLLHALGAALVDAVAQLSGNYMATSIDSVEVRVEALVIKNQGRVEKR